MRNTESASKFRRFAEAYGELFLLYARDMTKGSEVDGDDLGSPWLGTTEAARYLGVVPRTLYRMIDEGRIPAFKLGRVIRLRVADLEAFLESNRVQPGELKHLYPPPVADDDDA